MILTDLVDHELCNGEAGGGGVEQARLGQVHVERLSPLGPELGSRD